MGTHKNFIDTIDNLFNEAKKNNIFRLETGGKKITNNTLELNNKKVIHFGSCSYLGLEFNEKTKNGSIEAIKNYGTQFSSSRAYISIKLYREYETLLSKIFNAEAIVLPTTTLAHIAAIPNQVNNEDAVILDHQVHSSVQNAVNLLKYRNIHVETLVHNDMKMLEDRIQILLSKHDKVWYMADGIYSMYGDGLPAKELEILLKKYKNFRLYVDDAHGMSWAGKNGKGYVLSKMELHPNMIVATSLAKGFGSGGGVLIFPSKTQADLIRNCAGPLVTSGPLQPANIGAGIAAAKIHLTNELEKMQEELMDNINYTNLMLKKSKLPVVFNSDTPIFFIGTSLPKIAYQVIKRMLNDGFYLNLGIFPGVPMKNTGIRFTITRLHTFNQIEAMINLLEKHYFDVINEENFDISNIYSAFNIKTQNEIAHNKTIENIEGNLNLKLEHFRTIKDVNKKEWDTYFTNKGTFDWDGLKLMEESFSLNETKENNWDFDYIIIKDRDENIVLATFFTTAKSKDDMFAPASISLEIEKERVKNPNYLTSKTLFMGSLFSEGEHLFLNKNSKYWKQAMNHLFIKTNEIKNKRKATSIVLRDFIDISSELNSIFVDNGYYKSKMPNNYIIDDINWENETDFLKKRSSNSRRQINKYVLKHKNIFNHETIKSCNDDEKIEKWYNLYLNVKRKSLDLNTYPLPFKLFKKMAISEKWEKIELKIDDNIVAIVFSYVNGKSYNPMLIGLDYNYNNKYSCYRQAIYKVIMRAKEINASIINLGFSADIEKKRFGAKPKETYTYICTDDTLNQTIMSNLSSSNKSLILN